MNLEVVLVVTGVWIALGLGVALTFGKFIHDAESPKDAAELSPKVVKYLRPRKRTTPRARNATPAPEAASAPKPARRLAG
jgi:hypothetical protein